MPPSLPPRRRAIDIGEIERSLVRQGSFCVLHWLLEQGLIADADYQDWRDGRRQYLTDAMALGLQERHRLLEDVQAKARALGLQAQAWDMLGSAAAGRVLLASAWPDQHQQLTQQWVRATAAAQFDLFMDNHAAMAERQLCEQLAAGRLQQAADELNRLLRLDPDGSAGADYRVLIDHARSLQAVPSADEQGLVKQFDALEQSIQPLAQRLLGAGARDYLRPAWRWLARATQAIGNAPREDPRLHPSYPLMQIPNWAAVRDSLQADPLLLQQPLLLQRLALAWQRCGSRELGLLWALQCVDRHPDAAVRWLDAAEVEQWRDVGELWNDYLLCERQLAVELPVHGFIGFVLVRHPGLIRALQPLPALSHPASAAVLELLRCRFDGGDELPLRRQLAAVDPLLLKLYLWQLHNTGSAG